MMWIEEIDCPNVNFFTSGEVTQAGVIEAYKYLAESYRGVFDFIGMLEDISAKHNLWMNCDKAKKYGVNFRSVTDGLMACAADYNLIQR